MGYAFVRRVHKHQDTCSRVVCRVGHLQGETCVSMMSKYLLSTSLNSALISPLNEIHFCFLCRKMAILEAVFSSDQSKVFNFSPSGTASNATSNHSRVCIEGLSAKVQ